VKFLQLLHVLAVKLDKLAVLVDARRGYGFSEYRGAAGNYEIWN
jgi:hypothetical protein